MISERDKGNDRQRLAGNKPRITVSLSAGLMHELESERWRRKALSMSGLVETLLWEALHSVRHTKRYSQKEKDGNHNQDI